MKYPSSIQRCHLETLIEVYTWENICSHIFKASCEVIESEIGELYCLKQIENILKLE